MTDQQKREQYWRQINLLARSYLQLQQTRVGGDLRLLSMEDQYLKDEGLIQIIEEVKIDEITGSKTTSRKKKIIDESETGLAAIAVAKQEIMKSDPYRILNDHVAVLNKQEDALLKDAVTLAKGSELHDLCLRVKGWGPVATLTLMGYINPTTMTTPAKMWSNFGLTPSSRMRKGVQANYNPKIKGRLWMITRNVIMAQDPYYTFFYYAKKEYYKKRPDLLTRKEDKPKGWNAMVNAMAYRVMMKIMLSNAWEIIYANYHGSEWSDNPNYRQHRNYIPPKPVDETLWKPIHDRYVTSQNMLLEELNGRYPDKELVEEDPIKMDEYMAYMKNAKIQLD